MADALEKPGGLERLNSAEREALALLARGHTVKSIATFTGQTPNAVNERLRSARRKTGVGSSRELARLFDLQETRAQQNGTAGRAAPAAGGAAPARPRRVERAPLEGALTMSLVAVTLAALALQLAPPPVTVPTAAPDPLIDGLVGKPNPDLHALHLQVHAGPRNEFEEGRLRAAYLTLPAIARGVSPIRVVCSGPICEVSGALLGADVQPAMDALQGAKLADAVKPLGLSHLASGFGGEAKRGQATFVSYLERPD